MSNTNILAELQKQLKIADAFIDELQSDIEDWKSAYDGFEEKLIELQNEKSRLEGDNKFLAENNVLLLAEIAKLNKKFETIKEDENLYLSKRMY